MPAEKHYWSGQVEGDGREPDLTITWAKGGRVSLNGREVDSSATARLIENLRRAHRQTEATHLKDYRPVPEGAFYSPSDGAVSIDGETYRRVAR